MNHCKIIVQHCQQFYVNYLFRNCYYEFKFDNGFPFVAIFDEGASFFGQLGRHSGNKELDRGLFNTLWTCPVLNSRDTISNQVRSESPRFNLCFATHADVTMRLLNGIIFILTFNLII